MKLQTPKQQGMNKYKTHIEIQFDIYMYIYVYIYIHDHVCIYIYIYMFNIYHILKSKTVLNNFIFY